MLWSIRHPYNIVCKRFSHIYILFLLQILQILIQFQNKYSPVVARQLQLRQPLESIATQLISHVDTSNGGHPPAPCPPPAGDCVVPEVTAVTGGTNK